MDGDEILELYHYLIEHYEKPFLIHSDRKPANTIPTIRKWYKEELLAQTIIRLPKQLISLLNTILVFLF